MFAEQIAEELGGVVVDVEGLRSRLERDQQIFKRLLEVFQKNAVIRARRDFEGNIARQAEIQLPDEQFKKIIATLYRLSSENSS